jgi:cytochrome c-type biogenesis protein CcmH/NrfG
MRSRVAVIVMAVLLALYLVLVGQRAVLFVLTGEPVAVAIGIALIVLPVVGAWALTRELLFGFAAERLGRRLDAEGGLPPEEFPARPSGRLDREAVDSAFPHYRTAVEDAPSDWRTWYRLGLAYDGAGDRRRARQAVRQAIRLAR